MSVPMSTFRPRLEARNLNAYRDEEPELFKAIGRAIEGERARQIELIEEGKAVVQETRRWDDNKEYSCVMRSKEDAKDYRYFPDSRSAAGAHFRRVDRPHCEIHAGIRAGETGTLRGAVRTAAVRCGHSDRFQEAVRSL